MATSDDDSKVRKRHQAMGQTTGEGLDRQGTDNLRASQRHSH